MTKLQQGCILVACVVSTVPSHNVCGTHNQFTTNGGKRTTLLRDTGGRHVNNTTKMTRHTEHTVTLAVTVPGQSECALILTHNTVDTKPGTGGGWTRDRPPLSQASTAIQAPPRVYGSSPQRAHWQTLPVNMVQVQHTQTIPRSNPHGQQQPQFHTPRTRTASIQRFQPRKSVRNASSGGGGAGRGHDAPPQAFWVGNKGKSRCKYRRIPRLSRTFSQPPGPVTVHQQPDKFFVDFFCVLLTC